MVYCLLQLELLDFSDDEDALVLSTLFHRWKRVPVQNCSLTYSGMIQSEVRYITKYAE